MAEIKALILQSPLFRRRRDHHPSLASTASATTPRSAGIGSGAAVAASNAPPPYEPEDPSIAHPCQAPTQSFQPLIAPQASHYNSGSHGRRTSLPNWNRSGHANNNGNQSRTASPSPPPPPPFSDTSSGARNGNGNGHSLSNRRASTPSYAAIAPPPPPPPVSAPHVPASHISVHVHEAASPPYSPAPGREHFAEMHSFSAAASSAAAGPSNRRTSRSASRSPSRPAKRQKGHISSLPLGLLHQILTLTLDPTVTPSLDPYLDPELEPCLRVAVLFKLRGVDRRFFLAATSILRDRLIPTYLSLLPYGASSDPHPPGGDGEDPTRYSVFAQRSRETAVLDRFIAVRVGEDLRKAESALCDDSGEQANIFSSLQPVARTEDLLLTLPPTLISPHAPPRGDLFKTLPLPHPHLLIQNTPLWTSLYVSQGRVDVPQPAGWRAPRKTLVVEIRRRPTPEETVLKLREALEHIRRGWREWGEKIG